MLRYRDEPCGRIGTPQLAKNNDFVSTLTNQGDLVY